TYPKPDATPPLHHSIFGVRNSIFKIRTRIKKPGKEKRCARVRTQNQTQRLHFIIRYSMFVFDIQNSNKYKETRQRKALPPATHPKPGATPPLHHSKFEIRYSIFPFI
ncbi:MAG: hypothetical protein KGS48_16355, partial [Bacteroidetes bacterium]|nr:hypothetical protein [Bacteroidota bacterium]